MKSTLLQVRDLGVSFRVKRDLVPAIHSATFAIGEGEVVGVLGESGSGKTTVALTAMQMLPASAQVLRGSVQFGSHDLLAMREEGLQKIRGAELAMIFQEPALSLNPVIRVGSQISDVVRVHRRCSRQQARAQAEWVLTQVGLSDASRVYDRYPHELSGGQKQRVAIAQAIACRPALVIADEPTSNLDTTTQAEVLALFKQLKERLGMAFLFITHNPALLPGFADRVLVFYAGRIVEENVPDRLYARPLHPYTAGLIQSIPRMHAHVAHRQPLKTIPGSPPNHPQGFPGCIFEPRCRDRMPVCSTQEPNITQMEASASVRCFKWSSNDSAAIAHREACS